MRFHSVVGTSQRRQLLHIPEVGDHGRAVCGADTRPLAKSLFLRSLAESDPDKIDDLTGYRPCHQCSLQIPPGEDYSGEFREGDKLGEFLAAQKHKPVLQITHNSKQEGQVGIAMLEVAGAYWPQRLVEDWLAKVTPERISGNEIHEGLLGYGFVEHGDHVADDENVRCFSLDWLYRGDLATSDTFNSSPTEYIKRTQPLHAVRAFFANTAKVSGLSKPFGQQAKRTGKYVELSVAPYFDLWWALIPYVAHDDSLAKQIRAGIDQGRFGIGAMEKLVDTMRQMEFKQPEEEMKLRGMAMLLESVVFRSPSKRPFSI